MVLPFVTPVGNNENRSYRFKMSLREADALMVHDASKQNGLVNHSDPPKMKF